MTDQERDDLQTLLVVLKTLADETRIRILALVANQQRSVEELAVLLDLRPSTVSWHLARLKEIDLVQMRAEGPTHLYRVNGKGLGRIHKLLGAPGRLALVGDVEEDAFERKVLRDFFEAGRLKEIPAYRKKRQIILRWLVRQFEEGRTYTEAEVNEVIKRYHPDTATLRRELVGEKLMARERGVYWRTQPDAEQQRVEQPREPEPDA